MIKINQLRIGNLVYDHLGRMHKVAEIRAEHLVVILSSGTKLKYHIKTFKPVPITMELLYQVGLLRHHGDFGNDTILIKNVDRDSKEFNWNLCPAGLFSAFSIPNSKPLMYMHQVQNICFSLTEEEL